MTSRQRGSRSRPTASTQRGSSVTSTPLLRAVSAAKARSKRLRARHLGSRRTSRSPQRGSRGVRRGGGGGGGAGCDAALGAAPPWLADLPQTLRERQPAFADTGGLHATGLFDRAGELLCVREDVGRHNAMAKVLGWAFRERLLPLAERILCVSGRLSFELVQQAAVAGCPVPG